MRWTRRTADAEGLAPIDRVAETAGRWSVDRLTRRSFFGRVGRTAVLVASGPTVAGLISGDAEARVCGQSGVSPKCPAYDCNDVWGWCWYATGCCAGGLLKKICDCCAVDWPNVHGYCPSGTNVRCIMESCGTDPRVQTVPPRHLRSGDDATLERLVAGARFPGGANTIVLVDGADPRIAALGAPVAASLSAPWRRLDPAAPASAAVALAAEVGATSAHLIGPLPFDVDTALQADGVTVHRIGGATEAPALSAEVGRWVATRTGATDGVGVAGSASAAELAIAASAAAALKVPLFVGSTSAAEVGLPVLAVGSAANGDGWPSGTEAVTSGSAQGLSRAVATRVVRRTGTLVGNVTVHPDVGGTPLALAATGAPLLLHPPGAMGSGLRQWIFDERGDVPGQAAGRFWLSGGTGRLGTQEYADLQSALNGFESHLLIGVAGQGLPVISQPRAEREVGRARLGTDPPPPAAPLGYWSARAVD